MSSTEVARCFRCRWRSRWIGWCECQLIWKRTLSQSKE